MSPALPPDASELCETASANVLMVSTSYPRDAADWRGAFMRPLVEGFARRADLRVKLWAPPGQIPASVVSANTPGDTEWLSWLMDAGGISHLLRHPALSTLLAPLALLRKLRIAYRRHASASLYHVNWLQCALPLPNNDVPVLVSVLGNDIKLLRLPLMRTLLRRVMRGRRVAICPNADWMRAGLADAFGDIAEITPVAFGIDAGWYEIERRPPAGVPIWVVVTRLTADKLGPLLEWSAPLFTNKRRELHLYGPMQETLTLPDWVRYHGPTNAGELLHSIFPKATGLITLSRHTEGRPQVMLEAMAAGLPIVASRTSAHLDVISDGNTGIVCDSSNEYATAIDRLEEPMTNAEFGAAARRRARSEYGTWDDCVNRYLRVYSRLRNGRDA